jgi:hypothetical protein
MTGMNRLLGNIDRSFHYYVRNQWSSSDTFRVNVLDDPNVLRLSLRYFYPDYLNRRTDYIENSDGFINVPQFTEIEMIIYTPNTVREANLVFSDRSFLRMESQGRDSWGVKFTPAQSINYHFSLIDELGSTNQIVSRSISIIRDQPPLISFVYPAADTVMTQNNLFEVRLSASDDHGLRNLRIFYQVNQNPIKENLIFRQHNSNFVILSHVFDFRADQLFPGDEIEYWAEVFDNSPLNQKAETRRFKLRFPSIEDIFRELERQEEERSNTLSQVHRDVQEIQREFDMKRREMLRKDEISWDDQQALERFINDQQTLNEMVENVANNYQQMIDQMQQNEAISQELLDKMQRIQEIMETIATDDLKRAMERMQQSIEQMNPNELRSAMENFQFNLSDFAEKLEQTLKLLQDIKNEQNLERALQIANEMHSMQENLHQRTQDADNVSQLSEDQQRIEDKLKALEEQLQKTIDDIHNNANNNFSQEMQNMLNELQDGNLSENLQESTQALQNNNRQQAMDSQSQSLMQMSRMISRMQDMQNSMSGMGMQQMVEAIQSTIYRLLMISIEHRDKVSRIGNDPVPFMPAFINDFESLQISINLLYQAPQVLLILGPKFFTDLNFTVNSYRTFFSDIQNSRFNNHRNMTRDVQAGINLLIHNLMLAMNNMDSSEGGGGGGMQSLMQSLQQMSTQQMMMNTLTQSILEQMANNGNRMSNQMRQQLQEIAAEEQRLADNLKRLMQTNQEAQRHQNTLNEIVSELEDVARRIRQNRIDQNLLDQQNRIMSRLLDVQRSINRRDNSNQRRGETAESQLWELPPELEQNFLNAAERQILEDEIQKLPLEYRQLILEYLRKLNE